MKRAKFIFIIIIISMLLSVLSACSGEVSLDEMSESDRAKRIIEMLNEKMESADSYTFYSESCASGNIPDVGSIFYTATTNEQYVGINGDNSSFVSSTVHNHDYSNNTFDQSYYITEGYYNGFLFRDAGINQFESTMKSSITAEEIGEIEKAKIKDRLLPVSSALRAVSDGDFWVVTFSDYIADDQLKFSSELSDITPGYYVSDVSITVRVKKDFSSWTNETTYSFTAFPNYKMLGGIPYDPTASVISRVSNINSTEMDSVDLALYSVCPELNMLNKITSDLWDKVCPKSGRAIVNIERNSIYRGNVDSFTENDDISFGTIRNSFRYAIDCLSNGRNLTLSYINGVRNENGNSLYSSDGAERIFIYMLFTAGAYQPVFVKDIRQSDDNPNSYIIDFHFTKESAAALTVGDHTYTDGSSRMIVTYDETGVCEIETVIKAWANGVPGGASLNINHTTTFINVD